MLLGGEGPIVLDRLGGGFGVLGALFSVSDRASLLMANLLLGPRCFRRLNGFDDFPGPWPPCSVVGVNGKTWVSFDFVRGSVLIRATE